MSLKKILFVCNSYQFKYFLRTHFELLKKQGIQVDIYLFDSPKYSRVVATRRGILDIPMQGYLLHFYIMQTKPTLVISITPKVGLLVLLARLFCFFRKFKLFHIHWFTGQIWCNDRAIKRFIKKIPDILLAKYASRIFLDSHTQLNYLVSQGFIFKFCFVPGAGSICGVDDRYINSINSLKSYNATTLKVGIVGRICEDKGVDDLIEWFSDLRFQFRECVKLLFFGNIEIENDELKIKFQSLVRDPASGWYHLGEVADKRTIFSQIDILLLCSKREGFSNVLIEAQASKIPVLVRDIYGVKDSFIDGVSGISFSSKDSITSGLLLLNDPSIRSAFGEAGNSFVKTKFLRSKVVEVIVNEYIASVEG